MPTGIQFTSKTKMLVALQTDQDIRDIEAQLEVAESMKKDHGDCYYVLHYPMPDGQIAPYALMHQQVFDENLEFASDEHDHKFVPVNIHTTPTNN